MPVRDLLNAASGASAATYIEDVFSTYLYTGTGMGRNVPTGIDLDSKGGMLWIKSRSAATNNVVFDTARGLGSTGQLITNSSAAATSSSSAVIYLSSTGFGLYGGGTEANVSGNTYASWTFRKQPKFFDVVTYTGNGSVQNISHSLGSVPGMIIVKQTNSANGWAVYHRSVGNASILRLNDTIEATPDSAWDNTNPTSTQFTVGARGLVNASGGTYVAYLFAHNAGGFGTTGTDNVISCGSYVGTGAVQTIELGYEPQYIFIKQSSSAGNWRVVDVMRGMSQTSINFLAFNNANAESASTGVTPTATGFTLSNSAFNTSGETQIYMAIRRPMKVPTDGTKVYTPWSLASSGSLNYDSQAYYYDLGIIQNKDGVYGATWSDRLRGIGAANAGGTVTTNAVSLDSSSTAAETTSDYVVQSASGGITSSSSAGNRAIWALRRASGFFDEVCYTGTGGLLTINHNLSVIPELVILKARGTNAFGTSNNWFVYCGLLGGTVTNKYLLLNTTAAVTTNTNVFGNAAFTSTTFGAGGAAQMDSGVSAVAYLFATCPGVSKVGSYTGTGATQTINCGFTGGARFVLIKRTDSTGDWYVWDTARGMISGTDPSLLLNSTAAEVNANSIYTATTGFQIVSTAAGINASGGSYIFLAIA
jgi:hypothetical protein